MNAQHDAPRIDLRSEFLALVTGEFCRTQGLDLIRELEAAGLDLREVRAGDAPGRIDFVLEDGVIRQDRTPGWPMLSGWHLVLSEPSEGLHAIGRSVEDAVGAIANYLEEVRPTTLVERALRARRTADERDRADLRSAAHRMVIDAYEGMPLDLRNAFQTVIAYLALIEEQVGPSGGEVLIAAHLHRLMRLARNLPQPEGVPHGDVSADLRRIVTAHTRVGGYPNTMGIARSAYDLGTAHGNREREPTPTDTTGVARIAESA